MRKRLAIITALLLVVALAGCTHPVLRPVQFEVKSPQSSGLSARMASSELQSRLEASPGTAVILPFADYSPDNSPAKHLDIHEVLQVALQKEMRAADLEAVAMGNQVASRLLSQGVILEAPPLLEKESPQTASLLHELKGGGWCAPMNEKIGRRIHQNLIATRSLGEIVKTQALDARAIQAIGAAFSADYVVRGRITVYQSGLKWTEFTRPEVNLAFYFPTAKETIPLMGVADLQAYEFFDGRAMAPPQATIRSEEHLPFQRYNVKITPLVRLDLFIQDARTGEVVFVNACEVRASELYTLSDKYTSEPYELADRAIRKGVDALIRPLTRSPRIK